MFIELHHLPNEEYEEGYAILFNVNKITFVEDTAISDEYPESCRVYTSDNCWFYVQESYDVVKSMIREAINNVRNS
ncbi:MAG: hypothetical protein J6U54_20255 [Clostridiales bacterium]|nr:hypothetical protein [Clostridiales bacterium]